MEGREEVSALVRILLWLLSLVVAALFMVSGCASVENPNSAKALARRQQAVQDCILQGGHPVLGPSNTILCK